MNFRQLEYFVTIAEESSISRAARKLYMTQPPLSNSMRELEEELNCVLFERGSRSIRLTDEGRLLYERARSILQLGEATKEDIQRLSDQKSGKIRLGIISSLASTLGSDIIAGFNRVYPWISFELIEGNTYELLEGLRNSTISAALIRTPYQVTGFETVNLASERMLAVSSEEYYIAERIDLKQLKDKPLMVYRRWQSIVSEELSKKKINREFEVVADDARTVLSLAQKGMGIGIVPSSALTYSDKVSAMEIADLNISSDVNLLYDGGIYMAKTLELFVEYVKLEYCTAK